MNYDQLNELLKSQSISNKKNFDDLLHVINKRKLFIIISFIIIFLGGFIYMRYTPPTYESTVLLKKEDSKSESFRDDPYRRFVALQSQDDISTDILLVTTGNVLHKVVNSLEMNFKIDKIVYPDSENEKIEKLLPSYKLWLENNISNKAKYPVILSAIADSLPKTTNFFIKFRSNGQFDLYKTNEKTNTFIGSFQTSPVTVMNTSNVQMSFFWQNVQPGTELYFTVYDRLSSFNILKQKISVSQKQTTNLIEISVKDANPKTSQLIARTLVNKFNEARTEQQRENIQSSYALIDSQLTEISKKLKIAEDNLSSYQSRNGITKLDRSSDEITRFLSNLETEKINTDLNLSEYEEKQAQMSKEYKNKGYFDQTYLSPNQTDQSASPFASLLKQLSDLEVKKIQLLQKETESHPDIVNINNQIEKTKSQLSSYNKNTLTAFNILTNSLKEKKSKLENLISEYQYKVQSQPRKETILAGLIRDKDVYEKVFNLLLDKREESRVKELSQLQDIVVVDNPTLPISPVSPNASLTGVACFFIWGSMVILYLFIAEYRERKFLKLNEIESNLKLPLLSIIPAYSKKFNNNLKISKDLEDRFAVLSNDEHGINESFKVLRTKLSLRSKDETKIIMVSSCEEHSGKSSIVANLALSLISIDKKVLIIDADLKRCTLSDMFNISRNFPGLNSFLKGEQNKPPIINLNNIFGKSPNERFLSFLPAGDVNEQSSNILQSSKTQELINALKTSSYDYVLIDTPPLTRVVDALILSELINNILLVVRYNYSLRESVIWGIEELNKEKTNILGVVANACDVKRSSFKHKYGYGYSYKYAYEPTQNKKKKKLRNVAAI